MSPKTGNDSGREAVGNGRIEPLGGEIVGQTAHVATADARKAAGAGDEQKGAEERSTPPPQRRPASGHPRESRRWTQEGRLEEAKARAGSAIARCLRGIRRRLGRERGFAAPYCRSLVATARSQPSGSSLTTTEKPCRASSPSTSGTRKVW
jgi:hypothetical protein